MSKKNSVSGSIGKGLAYIQSFFDDLLITLFDGLKSVENKEVNNPPKTLKDKTVFYAKKTTSFLGDIGKSFYENYEMIKAEKINKKNKK